MTPSETREAGYLELDHFGTSIRGLYSHYDLTGVSQRWLRELLWDHLAHLLRTPGSPRTKGPYDDTRRACLELSTFLEIGAEDGGHDPALLQAEHVHRFLADQRHRARDQLPSLAVRLQNGKPCTVTDTTLHFIFSHARKIMRWALESGAADRAGLDREFVTAFPPMGTGRHRTRSPFTDDVARALADETNLQRFADAHDPDDRGLRDIWETIIVTGRRASEVIKLRLDCVGRYNKLPMLWHDQTKVGNYDQAIRMPEYTFQRIKERQRKTLARFEGRFGRPATAQERARMALFPASKHNPGFELGFRRGLPGRQRRATAPPEPAIAPQLLRCICSATSVLSSINTRTSAPQQLRPPEKSGTRPPLPRTESPGPRHGRSAGARPCCRPRSWISWSRTACSSDAGSSGRQATGRQLSAARQERLAGHPARPAARSGPGRNGRARGPVAPAVPLVPLVP